MAIEKCHSSDAACLKRNREARKAASQADFAKRRAAFEQTGDKKAFYEGRTPDVFAKGELKDLTEKTSPINKMGSAPKMMALDNDNSPLHKYMGFKKLAAETSPALAAYIGRKKYGKKKFQDAAAKGKKLG